MIMLKDLLNEGVDDPGILKAIFIAGGPGCFDGDTLVKIENGYKKISEIDEGEKVWTLDKNGDKVLSNVAELLEYDVNTEMVEIELENGEIIKCTPDHEIRLSNNEWIFARDLKDGYDILCY